MNGCAQAILGAVMREIELRASHLDSSHDIGEITVTVKLQAGTTWVRSVLYQELRVVRQQGINREIARTT